MKKYWVFTVLALLALTANYAVYATPSVAKIPKGIHIVKVAAKEYKFEMPDTISAGPTLFKFTNNGSQLHHMTIVRFEQGKTLADFTSLPPGPLPTWAVFLGGPNSPMPHGGQVEDVVDLKPGNYAAFCFIPGPDGKPHWMHGMLKAFTVTPARKIGSKPTSDLTLTLLDYVFRFSTPPTAGHHVIRVVNKGTQIHEAEIFRLQPGKKGEDVLAWVESGMKGPPPGAPVAGVTGEAPEYENYLAINFTHGHYALICFMPTKDGKTHANLGMIYNFKI